MKSRLKSFQTIVLIILVLPIFLFAQKDSTRRLYGNINFEISPLSKTQIISVRSFRIELRGTNDVKKDSKKKKYKILHKTHPDLRGYFSFKDVPEGRYSLRVAYLNPFGDKGISFETVYEGDITVKYDKKGMIRLKTIDFYVTISGDEFGGTKKSPDPKKQSDGV